MSPWKMCSGAYAYAPNKSVWRGLSCSDSSWPLIVCTQIVGLTNHLCDATVSGTLSSAANAVSPGRKVPDLRSSQDCCLRETYGPQSRSRNDYRTPHLQYCLKGATQHVVLRLSISNVNPLGVQRELLVLTLSLTMLRRADA